MEDETNMVGWLKTLGLVVTGAFDCTDFLTRIVPLLHHQALNEFGLIFWSQRRTSLYLADLSL